MRIVFLGTGGSWPSPQRNVSAVVIKLNRKLLLFDCGEGTQRQLMRSSLRFMQIKDLFLSHWHGDHFLGIPGLIQSMSLNDREEELAIYGPKGTKKFMRMLLGLGYYSKSFPIILHELKDKDELDFVKYKIKVRKAKHHVPTLAYCLEEKERMGRFDLEKAKALGIPEGPLYNKLQRGKNIVVKNKKIKYSQVIGPPRKGRKIVYANDTMPCDSVVELAMGCDVLIHDATLRATLAEKASKFGHSTTKEAAEIAKKASARKLFLVHISPRYKNIAPLEQEANEIFPNTTVAEDLMEYVVKG